jgi:uncharacterized protein
MRAADWIYAAMPFVAWFVAGVLKFCINSARAGRLAFDLMGYGGLPSNHSTIVTSMAALVGFREGVGHPAFGVAVTVAFIVMLDANSLRRRVGEQAVAINRLLEHTVGSPTVLRERVGHTKVEITAGLVLGIVLAWAMDRLA